MEKRLTAKQITIRYFSIVAVAIIAVHYTVYELTTDDLEYRFVDNRLESISSYLREKENSKLEPTYDDYDLFTQGKTNFSKAPRILLNFNALPNDFPDVNSLPYNTTFEVEDSSEKTNIFIMKVNVRENTDTQQDALIVIDNDLYELSEEQIFLSPLRQIIISIVLTLVSLFVVVKISIRLTQPISDITKTLASQKPEDLTLDIEPNGSYTQELEYMVNTLNGYQKRIQTLIERERSFNRYASHELRSPLMVIQGAAILLKESNDPLFISKQRQRLLKASGEMSEFIETLLSLTRPLEASEQHDLELNESLIKSIVINHNHLLEGKPIEVFIDIQAQPMITIPHPAFSILLGNIIKNAFSYTDEGEVTVSVTENKLYVIDTGKGFQSQADNIEGYGLGLLLVRDICQQYGFKFKLRKNDDYGSKATVTFKS